MVTEKRAILSIGSNVDRGEEIIRKALSALGHEVSIASQVSIYSTPPAGGHGRDYFNAVVEVATHLSPEALSSLAKDIERRFGRDESCRLRGIVPVDIDVVVFDGQVIRPRDYAQPYFRIGYVRLCAGGKTDVD